ncbi:hypothetical protein IAR55_004644 [Kwoniella newhampshirensis]|uniref:Uncharacterized protein n=1 Tax=Kwoniella newhampshirensis TaxID=1651941 RepID=A0AAW0YY20_9TREE
MTGREVAAFVFSAISLLVTLYGWFLSVRKQMDMFTHMSIDQREACRRLISNKVGDDDKGQKEDEKVVYGKESLLLTIVLFVPRATWWSLGQIIDTIVTLLIWTGRLFVQFNRVLVGEPREGGISIPYQPDYLVHVQTHYHWILQTLRSVTVRQPSFDFLGLGTEIEKHLSDEKGSKCSTTPPPKGKTAFSSLASESSKPRTDADRPAEPVASPQDGRRTEVQEHRDPAPSSMVMQRYYDQSLRSGSVSISLPSSPSVRRVEMDTVPIPELPFQASSLVLPKPPAPEEQQSSSQQASSRSNGLPIETRPPFNFLNDRRRRIPDPPIHGTTAYNLEVMLHGDRPKTRSISLDSPELRFDGNRCLFLASASGYWSLLTAVFIDWGRPSSTGSGKFLRAISPWGTTTFYRVNFETFAHFEPRPFLNQSLGECLHLRDYEDKWGRMEETNFFGTCFMVHMQERTARRIYLLAKDLYLNNRTSLGDKDVVDIVDDEDHRTAYSYSQAAVNLFDLYLNKYASAPSEVEIWTRVSDDPLEWNLFGDETTRLHPVCNELDLGSLMAKERRAESEAQKLGLRDYQTFITAKLRRLIKKAVVYDDRFAEMGFQEGNLWIG